MRISNPFQCITLIICSILVISKLGGVLSLMFPRSITARKIISCTQESKLSHSITHRSTSRKLPTVYLNSSDELGSEKSDRHWKILQENRFFLSRSWLIDSMGMVKKLPTTMLVPFVSFIMFSTMALHPERCAAAVVDEQKEAVTSTTTTISKPLKRTSRYWSMVESSDPVQIMTANEKLLDQAVGTINTMYYDKSGGADFSPKDVYDRWKVLKTYSKEGIEGVKVINNKEAIKQQMRDKENKKLQQSNSGRESPFYGNGFSSQLFSIQGDSIKLISRSENYRYDGIDEKERTVPSHAFDNRENAVASLKWLVSTIGDPYSKYLTREELQQELQVRDGSFLGLGAIVEAPPPTQKAKNNPARKGLSTGQKEILSQSKNPSKAGKSGRPSSTAVVLTSTRVANLPVVTAIVPDSPAERAGLIVGDRFAAIGSDNLIGLGRDEIIKKLNQVYRADNYLGYPDITVTKPIIRLLNANPDEDTMEARKEEVIGYKLSRVRLPTTSVAPFKPYSPEPLLTNSESLSENPTNKDHSGLSSVQFVSGGDSIVNYELLTPDDSIFRRFTTLAKETSSDNSNRSNNKEYVGYIRITRFSRSATVGYVNAVNELEKAGAKSYIIDIRNNYGGVIQEAMLTASSLLRDPHAVLCYTMNSLGGFTLHDVEEYVVDKNFPGYLLSIEKPSVTLQQVKRDNPEFVNKDGSLQEWYPPSSYASLREQRTKRGNGSASRVPLANAFEFDTIISNRKNLESITKERKKLSAQKNIVVLVNEGTASAAEVFVSSLHDNGRTVATIGSRTYGKGLIQHTFPMPDGGGLRLTVAEYLTPTLQHVTKVGNARYDPWDDKFVRGGIRPDIYCPSKQGIPSNAGADICVGIALDALENADVGNFEEALPLTPLKSKATSVLK